MTHALIISPGSSDKNSQHPTPNILEKMFKSILPLSFCAITYIALIKGDQYIDDFSTTNDISRWTEHSDIIQDVGKSKGTLVLLRTSKSQRAVLFTLLNPQPCGAAFAGVRKSVSLDLTPYTNLVLKVKGRGQYNGYKLVLRDNRNNYAFCNFFKVSQDFQEVTLSLKDFRPYREGRVNNDPNLRLDLSRIISIGIQAYGGAYLPVKQSGVASLEIEWIKTE